MSPLSEEALAGQFCEAIIRLALPVLFPFAVFSEIV